MFRLLFILGICGLVNISAALVQYGSEEAQLAGANTTFKFDKTVYTAMLSSSEADIRQPFLRIHASGVNRSLFYDYVNFDCQYFFVDEYTGELFIKPRLLEYRGGENRVICYFVARAFPGWPEPITTVVVYINSDALFKIALLQNSPPENEPAGVRVSQVVIVPASGVDVRNIRCLLADDSDNFRLDVVEEGVYELLTTRSLDRETVDHYVAFIVCSNNDNPPVRAVQKMKIFVRDVNDNAPEFSQNNYQVTIRENNGSSVELLSVKATDIDYGPNSKIFYKVDDDQKNVRIGRASGTIYTTTSFDYEDMDTFIFHVIAADEGDPSLSSTATVTVTILDQNDNVPVFSTDPYFFTIDKNHDQGTQVGMVSAFDADAPPYNHFTYELSSESDIFGVDQETGGISLKTALDEDSKPIYHLAVAACDPQLGNSTADVFIFIG